MLLFHQFMKTPTTIVQTASTHLLYEVKEDTSPCQRTASDISQRGYLPSIYLQHGRCCSRSECQDDHGQAATEHEPRGVLPIPLAHRTQVWFGIRRLIA